MLGDDDDFEGFCELKEFKNCVQAEDDEDSISSDRVPMCGHASTSRMSR